MWAAPLRKEAERSVRKAMDHTVDPGEIGNHAQTPPAPSREPSSALTDVEEVTSIDEFLCSEL